MSCFFLTQGVVLTVILCKRLVVVYMFRVDVRETMHISKYNDYNTTVQPDIFCREIFISAERRKEASS